MGIHLIKATQPFERLNIDFKGPVPSNANNDWTGFYMITASVMKGLTVLDGFSRFPFAFPCEYISTEMISYIHSDRGNSFISDELHN